MGNEFTKDAQEMWDLVPEDLQPKILKNVFCSKCLKAVEIINYKGIVKDGLLMLNGKCKTCGHRVTRVID